MRRLGAFPDPDGLSQLLLRLTVSGKVYCLSHMTLGYLKPSEKFTELAALTA